jgi:DNA-binding protein H-NS
VSSYQELMAKAKELFAAAEAQRQKEIAEAITEIRTTMERLGISIRDLGPIGDKNSAKTKKKLVFRYRGPNGEMWAGGRGRKPTWVKEALSKGHTLSEFEIKQP